MEHKEPENEISERPKLDLFNIAKNPQQSLLKSVTQIKQNVETQVSATGETVTKSITEVSSLITNKASSLTQEVTQQFSNLGQGIGSKANEITSAITDFLIKNPNISKIVDGVNFITASEAVKELQEQYPDESPSQISQRLMAKKAFLAAGTELSNLIPNTAITMFGLDLAAVVALQAEMVAQIAFAYGMDLEDKERKKEILAIFGLSTGSNLGIEAGLGFAEFVPMAGTVVSASATAVMTYTLGYAACRYYEAKQNNLTTEETLVVSDAAAKEYIETALSQEVNMDWILFYVFKANHPEKSWEELQPELEQLCLSPVSQKAISTFINNPPSLETLLSQVNREFAFPLYSQCEKVILSDGVVTPEERKVLHKIETAVNLILEPVQA